MPPPRLPAPELPKYVLPRPEEVVALRALLLAEESGAVGIVGARRADERVVGVALSGDGRLAVSASVNGTLKVWEMATGRELHTLAGHTGVVRGVAMSGDGRLVLSASSDRTLKVWEVDTGRCLATFETDEPLYGCGFAHPFIVAGGQTGRVHFLRLMV